MTFLSGVLLFLRLAPNITRSLQLTLSYSLQTVYAAKILSKAAL